jgi:hypothetical protein
MRIAASGGQSRLNPPAQKPALFRHVAHHGWTVTRPARLENTADSNKTRLPSHVGFRARPRIFSIGGLGRQPFPLCPGDNLAACSPAQLAQDIADVLLNRPLAAHQRRGDLAVRARLPHEKGYVALALGQPAELPLCGPPARGRSGWGPGPGLPGENSRAGPDRGCRPPALGSGRALPQRPRRPPRSAAGRASSGRAPCTSAALRALARVAAASAKRFCATRISP